MFCAKCGKENQNDAKFCISCGSTLVEDSGSFQERTGSFRESAFLDFSEEKRVSKNFAIAALLLGIVNIVLIWVGSFYAISTLATGNILAGAAAGAGILFFSVVIGILVMVFQALVIFQWSQTLNGNIKNTQTILQRMQSVKSDQRSLADIQIMNTEISNMRLEPWAFWVYLGLYFIQLFVPATAVFVLGILGFIFLAVYLQMVFSLSKKLQDIKAKFYAFYSQGNMRNLHQIKSRNIGIFILLTIITFGIYWWYLLIVMSGEINAFLDTDQQIRKNL